MDPHILEKLRIPPTSPLTNVRKSGNFLNLLFPVKKYFSDFPEKNKTPVKNRRKIRVYVALCNIHKQNELTTIY